MAAKIDIIHFVEGTYTLSFPCVNCFCLEENCRFVLQWHFYHLNYENFNFRIPNEKHKLKKCKHQLATRKYFRCVVEVRKLFSIPYRGAKIVFGCEKCK